MDCEDGRSQENLYDAEGLRYGVKDDGISTRFVYYQGELLQEEREGGRNSYYLGSGIEAAQMGGELYYYHQDEQLSTALLTDHVGKVRNHYRYGAFGEMLEGSESVENRIRYTGQQYDEISDQYYLRARYYNPVVGRFLQEDVYQGDGLNLYAYCGNNPVMYYDPSGYTYTGKNKYEFGRTNGDGGEGEQQENARNNTNHLIGEKGTQTSSKTTWKNGKTERIDVENPDPGERSGQIHYHDSQNDKWYYDMDNNNFYDQKTGDLAPKRVQSLLKDKQFVKGIKKAMEILGEQND